MSTEDEWQDRRMILNRARFDQLDVRTLYALLRLRTDVFVVEQHCPYPELDGRDTEPDSWHMWLNDNDEPLAYLRVLVDPDGVRRIGRVCTAAGSRGAGLSGQLMTAALDTKDVSDGEPFVLDAQSYLVDFYGRFGFVADGPEFVEDGIPHTPMRRD
jgi:ElaA protein